MAKNMIQSAREATVFLKALANENRLLILCHLVDGEKSVSELERLLQIRQPTLSQQLARLRAENLVKTRRDAKTIFYSLKSEDVVLTIQLMSKLFCERDEHPVIELTRSLAPAA
jgi:ArsR family transcriptional regulator, virulence genes transcriptional regulator